MNSATSLLDGNVLIALTVPGHVRHDAARVWLGRDRDFATCPTVQGTLLRTLLRQGMRAGQAQVVLHTVAAHPRHHQWRDDITYLDVDLVGVIGHRQVTDAYLAQLARTHGGRLATFDRGLAQSAPDVVDLLPA